MNDPLQDVEHHRRILAKAFRLIIDQISEEERDNFIPLIVSSFNCWGFEVCNLNMICYVIFIPRRENFHLKCAHSGGLVVIKYDIPCVILHFTFYFLPPSGALMFILVYHIHTQHLGIDPVSV